MLIAHPDFDEWKLSRNKITVDKEIGHGEFGRIELAGLKRDNANTVVALKSLNSGKFSVDFKVPIL